MATIKNGKFAGRLKSSLTKKELEEFTVEQKALRKEKAHAYYLANKKSKKKEIRPNGYFFMIVTNDAFEIPLSPPCQIKDVERVLGINKKSINGMVKQGARTDVNHYKKTKVIKFTMDEVGEYD